MAVASKKPATFDDLAAREDAERLELIGGELVEKATPSAEHSETETKLVEAFAPFNGRPGGRWPGGWWAGSRSTSGIQAVRSTATTRRAGSATA